MTNTMPSYPAYARSERIADGTIHTLGVAFALSGAIAMISWALMRGEGRGVAALAVYGAALIATFTASAFYHMTPWEALRPTLRRIDHAAIYLKIAGTFTPLAAMIATPFAFAVLALVWSLAVWGMARKLFFWREPGRFGPALYLVMGWLAVLLMPAIAQVVPTPALVLLAVGGLLYTSGVLFYSWDSLKFSAAIWHGFVLAASVCFFSGIVLGAAAQT
jgi:hemolysin III